MIVSNGTFVGWILKAAKWVILCHWFLIFHLACLCPGPLEQFDNWLSSFSMEEKKGDVSELLVNSPSIRALYTKMVQCFTHMNCWIVVALLFKEEFMSFRRMTNLCFYTGASSSGSFRILAEIFLQGLSVGTGKLPCL